MTLEGTVRDGIIVLDNGVEIPDGTRVQVVVDDAVVEPPTLLGLLASSARPRVCRPISRLGMIITYTGRENAE